MASTRLVSLVIFFTIALTGFGSAIRIMIQPQPYNELDTQLNVTCITDRPTDLDKVTLTILLKGHGRVMSTTSIFKDQVPTMVLQGTHNMEAEVRIDSQHNKIYTTVMINQPGIQDGGLYECVKHGFIDNRLVDEWDAANVTYNEPDIIEIMKDLSQKVQEQNTKIDEQTNQVKMQKTQIDYLTQQHDIHKTLTERLNKEGTQTQRLIDHIQQQIRKEELCPVSSSPPLVLTRTGCPDGWKFYTEDQACLKFFRSPKLIWSEARNYCQRSGGDLVIIRDQNKNKFVTELYVGLLDEPWIGLKNHESGGYKWKYVDGSNLGSYHPWYPVYPIGHNYDGWDCVLMTGYKVSPGLWGDTNCSTKHPFVCSI